MAGGYGRSDPGRDAVCLVLPREPLMTKTSYIDFEKVDDYGPQSAAATFAGSNVSPFVYAGG